MLGLNLGCARIGYDLIEPVSDDGSSQGATSAESGAGKGGNSGGQGGTRAGGNAGEPARGGSGGATASGGTSSSDAGSPTGGAGETTQAGAGAAPAGGEGGATSPGAGRTGNGGTTGIGGNAGIGGNTGIGGNAGIGGNGTGGRGGSGGRSGGGTGGRSGGGSAGSCLPSESGVERCDGIDNDCSGVVDDAGACSSDCEGHVFAGASYMYCSTNLVPTNAAVACSNENMRLARVDSSAENEFIHQFVVVDTWLGGSDTSVEGRWTWPDGVVFWLGVASGSAPPGMYAPFDAEEPNDNFGMSPEDCLVLRPNGYWNDKPCSTTLPFMCKRY